MTLSLVGYLSKLFQGEPAHTLYCFVSHREVLDESRARIEKMVRRRKLEDYIIVVGGNHTDEFYESEHLLELKCSDSYEGLPNKVRSMFEFIIGHPVLGQYPFYCKLDRDMILKKQFTADDLAGIEYGGYVKDTDGDRTWHLGKCSTGSKFNIQPYKGEYIPWCLGGRGYILSNSAVRIISEDNHDYPDEIYEDLAIAKILAGKGISPQVLPSLDKFIASPEHTF